MRQFTVAELDLIRFGEQKKKSRLVLNLPAWLKGVLVEKAKADDMSMNKVVRIALREYLKIGVAK